MKKTILTLALVMAVGFAGISVVEARWGGGWGPGGCNGSRWSQNEDINSQARQQFYNETSDLRNQLNEKQGEYASLMNQDNVDKDIASGVWAEIFDLQKELQEKSKEAGLNSGYGGGGRFASEAGNAVDCNGPGSCWRN